MNNLNLLIENLCPNGVKFIPLKDAAKMQRGTAITKKDIKDGPFSVVAGGQKPAYYCDSYNRDGETVTVAGSGAYAGYIAYWNEPIFVSDAFSIKGNGNACTRYLFYVLQNLQEKIYATKKGGGVPHVHIASIEDFRIPLPPLPVQQEIVRILDNFMELTAELTAELAARRKQYEHYRDELLTFGDDVEIVPIRSVVEWSGSGGTPTKGVAEYYEGGDIPWIRTQDVRFNQIYSVNSYITGKAVEKTAAKWIPENCVIVAISGATAGRCAINKIRATTNQHCLNMKINPQKALYKYVFYCVCSKHQELLEKKQGARGDLNSTLVLDVKIPLPNLQVQQHIVSILDHFDALCNNLTSGLPAEITARQKQYEYYRDKLLTFKELEGENAKAH